ncbi:MAG: hypothetical protein CVV27_01505 [Candidatus Melainabacteria bacterium HGW-Melainabacteria-1]|nr:MAG: hypothetical protein CVV27_01505 [Candidatus Melainabacteria bacterium HGW-Melainabacteria-1]
MDFDCPYRILFGPIYNPAVLGRWLGHPNIRSFNSSRSVRVTEFHHSLQLDADSYYAIEQANFGDILAQLPPGWEPDLVIWYNLALMGLPPGIEECPWPTLAIVHDWPLNFQPTLDYLEAFDYVLCDRALLKVLQQQGFERAAYWPCYGHDPQQHYLIPGLERPWDVVFLGSMSYHYHRDRNPWLERISRLSPDYRVLISDRYYRDDYTRLLNQSKIVFNHSLRGEMNMRSFEAAACGALVLVEEDNLEYHEFLTDGESCVTYNSQNLEAKIAYYLTHDAERQRIAAAGTLAIANHSAERQFARLLKLVPAAQAAFASGARQRFCQAPAIWKTLLQARQLSMSLTPHARERSLALLQQSQPPPELSAHVEAVAGALGLNRHWDQAHLLDPNLTSASFPPEAHRALAQLGQAVNTLQAQTAGRLGQNPTLIWHAYNLACGLSLLRQPAQALPLWQQLLPQLAQIPIDFATLSWLQLLPRGHGRNLHEFTHLWDKTAAMVLSGDESAEALRRLLLWQAFELSGYCLMWSQQPAAAIAAFSRAEVVGPGSFFTYLPLLQLLLASGREQELLATLRRGIARLGLLEVLHRDLLKTLERQGAWSELKAMLPDYERLMTRFEGGGASVRDSPQAWMPHLLQMRPDLLASRLEWAGY